MNQWIFKTKLHNFAQERFKLYRTNSNKMKKLTLLLLLACSFLNAQESITIKKMNSVTLGTERILKIYVPESYEKNPKSTYPVAIIFDAEYLFDVYVANSKLFAAQQRAPEQIIVGILQNQNDERSTDCDFSIDTGLPNEESTRFYKFVREEVVNFIDDNYRTALFKTIVGQTLTGNYTNYFLLEPKPIFNGFVAINPILPISMAEKLEAKSQGITDNVFYYICNAKYNSDKIKVEINNVNNLLKLSEIEKFRYKFDNFENESSSATIGKAIPSAMDHIFKLFGEITKEEFDKNIAELSPPEAIAYLEKKYVEIEYLYGSNVKIREKDIFRIEPIIIDKENGDYLEEYGKMIMRLYPESPIGDYYIGLYYETGYDYKKALKHYKNGYAKITTDNPNADAYYANIERVLEKQRAQKLGLPTEEETTGETPAETTDQPKEEPKEE